MIAEAKKTVHLQTYIFEEDAFGTKVKEALLAAAAKGVNVSLLVDAVGSSHLSDAFAAELGSGGVEFCRFNPIGIKNGLSMWGRRLHHKVLLADDAALIGGINVVSETYLTEACPHLDFAVHIGGDICNELRSYCDSLFQKASGKKEASSKKTKFRSDRSVRISVSDWILHRWEISHRYVHLVKVARADLLIINSYFFPSKKFMKQLAAAAARGVRVRLILPKYSDWPSYVLATQYMYDYFLKNGIEIYQWKNSILHGKLATVDDSFTTIGSFNLNFTGYQQNLELNVDLYSIPFTGVVNQQAERWIAESCEKITIASFVGASTLWKIFQRLFFYTILSLVEGYFGLYKRGRRDPPL